MTYLEICIRIRELDRRYLLWDQRLRARDAAVFGSPEYKCFDRAQKRMRRFYEQLRDTPFKYPRAKQ